MVLSPAVFSAVLRDAGVALLLVNTAGRIQFANVAAHALLGRRELTGGSVVELFADADRATVAAFVDSLGITEGRSRELGPVELARAASRVVTITGSVLRDLPGFAGAVLSIYDVTDYVTREEELARAAYTDELTGLANRSLGLRHLRAATSPAAHGSILVIDIDGFTDLNEALGPVEGNRILVALAKRLTRAVPRGSVVARIGGDEFLVLLPRMAQAHAEDLAREVLTGVSLPIDVAGTPAEVTASIGVAPLSAANAEEVLARAFGALYVSKGRGPGGVVGDSAAARQWTSRQAAMVTQMYELRSEAERAREEARTDAGTGLPNRRRLDEDIPAIQQAATSSGRPVGVVFVDLDRFGLLNKHRGDDAGDDALAEVAAVLASQSRSGDRFYRKGGEEFVGLLQNTDMRAALLVAERLRAAVEATRIQHGGHPSCPTLTVSVGVAADLVLHRSVEQLVVAAGHEMLRAKRAGRNQVSPRLDIGPGRARHHEPNDDDAA